ncbi:MAG: tRNA lysidine(34) synthetase TilS [Hyphomicrobium sp.]
MSRAPRNAACPIASNEVDALFAPLAAFDAILLAVSGGSDSMALLELIHDWRADRADAAPLVAVATVDHGLRSESRAEAAFVATRCAELKLEHAILPWRGPKPQSGLANAARDARYRLLCEHARRLPRAGSRAIVTAHTEDDQAETVVMRLARGSGVDGLAAMPLWRPAGDHGDVALVRPLLGVAKARLIATLAARARPWREDPSNENPAAERVRVRAAMAALADAGVTSGALARAARRLGDARAALGYADRAFETTLSLDLNGEIFASLDRAAFADGPPLLRQRLLQRLIRRFGGETGAPSLLEVEALVARLSKTDGVRATLGGAVVATTSRTLKVWREAGRVASRDVALAPNANLLWDNRFVLSRDGRPDVDVRVGPLGSEGLHRLAPQWRNASRPPVAALHAQPAFWTGDDVIAAPSLAGVARVMQLRSIDGLHVQAIAAADVRNQFERESADAG